MSARLLSESPRAIAADLRVLVADLSIGSRYTATLRAAAAMLDALATRPCRCDCAVCRTCKAGPS